jgi:hypothetical protein
MKFANVLKKIILEQSRLEVLMDKFVLPKKDKEGKPLKAPLSKQEFFELIQADPTSRLNDVDLERASKEELSRVKVGEYTPWLIKSYMNVKTEIPRGEQGHEREVKVMRERFMEDLYKVTEDLTKFKRFKGKLPVEMRDINKLTPEALYDAVKDFDLTMATTTKAERKAAPVHPGAESGFEGKNWRVIKISDKGERGKEAACFYGGNQQETRWCTSAPGLSYFDRYIKDGPLYVIYNPNDTNVSPTTGLPKERYQFHFQSNQFMDKDDRSVNLIEYLNGPMAELKDYFKPEFAKGLTHQGKELVIDNFESGSVGKFIGLYGLDELFDSLPDDIHKINISTRNTRTPITFRIPDTISRFTNLDRLTFDGCITSVPDAICELKKLAYFAVLNCPEVKSIPACVATLPEIMIMNIMGSNNIVLPKEITDVAFEVGPGLYDFTELEGRR